MRRMQFYMLLRRIGIFIALAMIITGCKPEAVTIESTVPMKAIAVYIEPEEAPTFDDFAEKVFVKLVSSKKRTLDTLLRDPEAYGIKATETPWGDYTPEAIEEKWTYLDSVSKELKKFDYTSLTRGQKITYDQLKTYIDLELSMRDYSYFYDPLSPYDGEYLYFKNALIEHRMKTAEDAQAYLELLQGIKPFVEKICAYEKERAQKGLFMNEESAQLVLDNCNYYINSDGRDFISVFKDKLPEVEGISEDEKAELEKTNRKYVKDYVIPAYQKIYDTISKLRGSGTEGFGLPRYEGGKEYYAYLAQKRSGSSMTVDEMFAAMEEILLQNQEEIFDMIYDFDADHFEEKFFTFDTASSVIRNNLLKMSEYFPELYDSPKEYYEVKYLPEDYGADIFGSYSIPQIDNPWDNTIHIAHEASIGYYFYQTMSHETIPGHLYQTVYFLTSPAENIPLRYLIACTGYGLGTQEGWTTYIERISQGMAGLGELDARVLSLISQFELSWYTALDIGINYYGWTKKEAVAYFRDKDLRDIYKLTDEMIMAADAQPTRHLPYAVGLYELLKMKTKAEEKLGEDFSLIEFHRFCLETGPCTFDILNRELDQWTEDYLGQA